MENDVDCVRLVRQAQLGDTESLERLAKLAEGSLRENVYRMTLEVELTQDIVQETVLEMLKIFGELKEADRFWPWLYKIALNKLRVHRRAKKRQGTIPLSAMGDLEEQREGQEAMSELATRELKQIIIGAMGRLKGEQRAVLTMRCYKEMEYYAIAEALGCSEFAARKQFWRAKKALQRQLSREGFGKGSLLMALVVFGKMTARSEAAAAQVSVGPAATKVGVAAAVAGLAGTKTALVSLIAAGAVGVGAVAVTSGVKGPVDVSGAQAGTSSVVAERTGAVSGSGGEYWYLFPQGRDGPMMARCMKSGGCQWMQDGEGNYFFERRKNALYVNNYRQWRGDLSVWRLPTDGAKMREFLASVEGVGEQMGYVSGGGPGLLVVAAKSDKGGSFWETRHENILNEEYFRYGWPAGVKVVDNRDAMHRRGWTYFKISGQINGEMVLGTGRMAFVYEAAKEFGSWLRLEVGSRVRIVDNGESAVMYKGGGRAASSYAGGSFFKGLGRPWMGLHTIDSVRRDAAEAGIRFETKLERGEGEEKGQVVLYAEGGRLVYMIDMESDVIEQIRIATSEGQEGELRFTYLQEIGQAGDEFVEPEVSGYYRGKGGPGIMWLLQMIPPEADK